MLKIAVIAATLLASSAGTYAWDYWYSADSFYDDDPTYGEYDPEGEWLPEVEVKYKQSNWSDWGLDDEWWRTDDDQDVGDNNQNDNNYYWETNEDSDIYNNYNNKHKDNEHQNSKTFKSNNIEEIRKFLKETYKGLLPFWEQNKDPNSPLFKLTSNQIVADGKNNYSIEVYFAGKTEYCYYSMSVQCTEGNYLFVENKNGQETILSFNFAVDDFGEMFGTATYVDENGVERDFTYTYYVDIVSAECYTTEYDTYYDIYGEIEYEGYMYIYEGDYQYNPKKVKIINRYHMDEIPK